MCLDRRNTRSLTYRAFCYIYFTINSKNRGLFFAANALYFNCNRDYPSLLHLPHQIIINNFLSKKSFLLPQAEGSFSVRSLSGRGVVQSADIFGRFERKKLNFLSGSQLAVHLHSKNLIHRLLSHGSH